MTERLTELLRREADDLEVPAAPAARVLGRGRGLRRRRRLTEAGSVVAALAVIGGTAFALSDTGPGGSGPTPTIAPAAALEGWAVASGSTVHLGNGATAEVDGTVKSIYYTSAGVLVRTGKHATTDAADSRYSLVTETGDVTDFGLDLGDRVPSTDPTLPYFAYVEPTDDPQRWTAVLRDVSTGDVAHEIPISGAFTWGGWVAPPVALSGDHVYVALDEATLDVNWRTGATTPADAFEASYFPEAAGGRAVHSAFQKPITVRDAQSGAELLRIPGADDAGASISPDGDHLVVRDSGMTCTTASPDVQRSPDATAESLPDQAASGDARMTGEVFEECTTGEPSIAVYGVESGSRVPIDVDGIADLGWTPDGWLIAVRKGRVEVCEPDTGDCHATPIDVTGKNIRIGGSIYEA